MQPFIYTKNYASKGFTEGIIEQYNFNRKKERVNRKKIKKEKIKKDRKKKRTERKKKIVQKTEKKERNK